VRFLFEDVEGGPVVDVTKAVQVLYDSLDALSQGSLWLDSDEEKTITEFERVVRLKERAALAAEGAARARLEEAAFEAGLRVEEYVRQREERKRVEAEERAADLARIQANKASHAFQSSNVTWPCFRCGATRSDAYEKACHGGVFILADGTWLPEDQRRCGHRNAAEVFAGDELVALLCPDCNKQLTPQGDEVEA
jgi:hypothetical protein